MRLVLTVDACRRLSELRVAALRSDLVRAIAFAMLRRRKEPRRRCRPYVLHLKLIQINFSDFCNHESGLL